MLTPNEHRASREESSSSRSRAEWRFETRAPGCCLFSCGRRQATRTPHSTCQSKVKIGDDNVMWGTSNTLGDSLVKRRQHKGRERERPACLWWVVRRLKVKSVNQWLIHRLLRFDSLSFNISCPVDMRQTCEPPPDVWSRCYESSVWPF